MTFYVSLIASVAYSSKGDKLWPSKYVYTSKKRRGLSMNVDFGEYMKQWHLFQIMNYIAQVMEHHETRETDEWRKFKERVNLFNKTRMISYVASHVLVCDESMSAFIPRCVFVCVL